MERTTLGPVEQFRDDSGAWHVGRRVNYTRCGLNIYTGASGNLVVFRLYDSGQIILVDPSRLEPNEPNPPPFSESAAWREMTDVMERLPG